MSRNKERRDQEIYPFGRYILPGEGGGQDLTISACGRLNGH